MRHLLVIAGVAALLGCSPARVTSIAPDNSAVPPAPAVSGTAVAADTAHPSTPRVDFVTQVRPILESRCMPCHFEGGKMYARLPFDQPETILTLGTKLFTRIKDPAEVKLITAFLEEGTPSGKGTATGS